MQNPEFITFQKFNNPAMAHELGYLLEENNIEYQYEQILASFNAILGNEQRAEFWIKIRQADFKKADDLLQAIYSDQVENVDADYYLFSFTNKELLEIITKRDEWGVFDYVLAQKILKDRGKEIAPEIIEVIQENRIAELSQPEKTEQKWINAGYVSAILGGLFGFMIGFHLMEHKKILPTGDKIYGFSEDGRKQGRNILIFSVISFFAWLFIRILYQNSI